MCFLRRMSSLATAVVSAAISATCAVCSRRNARRARAAVAALRSSKARSLALVASYVAMSSKEAVCKASARLSAARSNSSVWRRFFASSPCPAKARSLASRCVEAASMAPRLARRALFCARSPTNSVSMESSRCCACARCATSRAAFACAAAPCSAAAASRTARIFKRRAANFSRCCCFSKVISSLFWPRRKSSSSRLRPKRSCISTSDISSRRPKPWGSAGSKILTYVARTRSALDFFTRSASSAARTSSSTFLKARRSPKSACKALRILSFSAVTRSIAAAGSVFSTSRTCFTTWRRWSRTCSSSKRRWCSMARASALDFCAKSKLSEKFVYLACAASSAEALARTRVREICSRRTCASRSRILFCQRTNSVESRNSDSYASIFAASLACLARNKASSRRMAAVLSLTAAGVEVGMRPGTAPSARSKSIDAAKRSSTKRATSARLERVSCSLKSTTAVGDFFGQTGAA
mmetsp:Transcript_22356/g.75629  ORF Transcript_22356/g.75629 Transcript_22356/m.75629 type:complete len:470 (-) Transcript_22356:793-2202(-)